MRNSRQLLCVSTSLAAVFAAQQVHAQAAPPPAGEAAADEVVVTGSRVGRSTFTAPTPVTVLGQDRLQELSITNVGDLLNDLPQFRGTTTAATQGPSNFNIGATEADLRGLGASRTLVLVDGQRFVGNPNTFYQTQAVDLNMIPSIMIDRTEVASGGASAQYGSDAVGGVVNIILAKRLQGYRGSLNYGRTERGDGQEWTFSFAAGTKLLNDKGHFVIGTEISDSKGVGNCYTRAYCANSEGALFTNAYATTVNSVVPGLYNPPSTVSGTYVPGLPYMNQAQHVYSDVASYGGLITTGALRGFEFQPDGSLRQHNYGSPRNSSAAIGGDGYYGNQYALIRVPSRRATVYTHFDYDITDKINFGVDFSLGHTEGSTTTIPPQNTGGASTSTTGAFGSMQIRADNPYLQRSGASSLYNPASSAVVFNLNRFSKDFGYETGHTLSRTGRIAFALKGQDFFGWNWDSGLSYSRNRSNDQLSQNRIQPNWTRAVDAVIDNETVITPGAGGIVCRDTLSANAATRAAAAGCVPLNLFGTNNFDPAAKNYIFGTARSRNISTLTSVNLNIRRNLFHTWAGPIAIAAGFEGRMLKIDHDADPFSIAGNYWTQQYGLPFIGKQKVGEGYFEANIPLLKDVFLAKSFDFDGAVRKTHDNFSGWTTSWKVGVDWNIVDWLRFRGTRSQDIRAPNTSELFLPGATAVNAAGFINRFSGQQDTNITTQGGGAINARVPVPLTPERAKSITFGLVFQPKWEFARGFRASIDYYDIKLKDAIRSIAAQDVIDFCYAGDQVFCNRLNGGKSGPITYIFTGSANVALIEQAGVDLEVSYRKRLSDWYAPVPGDLSVRVIANYADKLSTTTTTGTINRSGQTGGQGQTAGGTGDVPRYQLNTTFNWVNGPLSLTAQIRHIPKGEYNVTYIGPDDSRYASIVANPSSPLYTSTIARNGVDSATYVNMGARYKFKNFLGNKVEVFGQVNNVFASDPPFSPTFSFVTNATLFDVIGRSFRVGVRFEH